MTPMQEVQRVEDFFSRVAFRGNGRMVVQENGYTYSLYVRVPIGRFESRWVRKAEIRYLTNGRCFCCNGKRYVSLEDAMHKIEVDVL